MLPSYMMRDAFDDKHLENSRDYDTTLGAVA